MSQWLRGLAVLSEDLGSVPKTPMVSLQTSVIQYQEIQHHCLASRGIRHAHVTYTDMQANIQMHKGKIKS